MILMANRTIVLYMAKFIVPQTWAIISAITAIQEQACTKLFWFDTDKARGISKIVSPAGRMSGLPSKAGLRHSKQVACSKKRDMFSILRIPLF
jgi:hypothetical protein